MMQPAHEYFVIIYINAEKTRSLAHFNFAPNHPRQSHITFKIPFGSQVVRKPGSMEWMNTAQKPVKLMEWIIRHFSREGENVLDLCAGTGNLFFIVFLLFLILFSFFLCFAFPSLGTTTIAALRQGRNVFAVEREEEMTTVIGQRVSKLVEEMNEEAKVKAAKQAAKEAAKKEGGAKKAPKKLVKKKQAPEASGEVPEEEVVIYEEEEEEKQAEEEEEEEEEEEGQEEEDSEEEEEQEQEEQILDKPAAEVPEPILDIVKKRLQRK